ncbi:hypothetical protein BC938DRAFT_482656 [Jimgerdemannia flammicorona]|uniref:Uncharacterized protein n=1 Tax=Jimgerdemannia flammicorona TaxID=994334 RepID=A0A433QW62_9FUNG|nr:hypothetical protein BC938DRAFT_482656 [Jimgerdemannia flammicorona]
MEMITAAGGRALSKKSPTCKPKTPHAGLYIFFIFYSCLTCTGFYMSVKLANFDIPESYGEIGEVIKVARIMLQTKKILHSMVSRYKQIKEGDVQYRNHDTDRAGAGTLDAQEEIYCQNQGCYART